MSLKCNTIKVLDVIANDYDPNGHTPLTLVGAVDATIVTPTKLEYSASSVTGMFYPSYTITNSLGGTASINITVRVTGTYAACNEQ